MKILSTKLYLHSYKNAECMLGFELFNEMLILFETVGGDGQQEGLAGHRLGLAYEDVDDAETAILVNK